MSATPTTLHADTGVAPRPGLDELLAAIAELQRPDGGWPYEPGQSQGFTEPTCWAAIALHAAGRLADAKADAAAAFLCDAQYDHGGFHNHTADREANWVTTIAVLALSIMDRNRSVVDAGVGWLLGFNGQHWVNNQPAYFAHDTSIHGWPWIPETHSWDEPTCYAIMTLRRFGLNKHPRVTEARRMLLDRALPSGGWNYGNTTVLGTELRAFPSTTAMALIALVEERDRREVRTALAYLGNELNRLASSWALGWSVLAGRCYGYEGMPGFHDEKVSRLLADCRSACVTRRERLRIHEASVLALASLDDGHRLLIEVDAARVAERSAQGARP